MCQSRHKQGHSEEHVAAHNDEHRHRHFPLHGRVSGAPYLDTRLRLVGVGCFVVCSLVPSPLVLLGGGSGLVLAEGAADWSFYWLFGGVPAYWVLCC